MYFCLLLVVVYAWIVQSIVNPGQKTADIVIELHRSRALGPRTWQSGVDCLDPISQIYFELSEHLTRSYNLVVGVSTNMTTPAAQIQEAFMKVVNEAVSANATKRPLYQLRVVSDARPYEPMQLDKRELVYGDYYLLIVDNLERLTDLMTNYVSQMTSWNPGALFMVLFHNADYHDELTDMGMEILQLFVLKFYVHNLGLLYATGDMDYTFVVLKYYSNIPCRTPRMEKIGICRNGQPFPDINTVNRSLNRMVQTVSYKNCTFNLCASIAPPFVEDDCVLGIEQRIVGFVRNRVEFDIYSTCEHETRGIINEDGNWTGLLYKLNERTCDLILGGFYPDNEVIAKFWVTDCYLSDSHTFFVKFADPRPPWRAIISIFDRETWLCFVGMLAVTWFFWHFFVNMLPEPAAHKQLSLTSINNIGASICQSINERPECTSTRIFFTALCMYGLIVTAMYTSKLISVFTDPGYLHQIDTLEEAIAAGIPYGGYEENRDWFNNNDDMWIVENYNYSSLFEPSSQNLPAVQRGERIILSSRMYVLQNNLSDSIFAFPRNVFSSPMQMIVNPGFPFLSELNWFIRYMRDMGIFDKIDKDFRYNNTYLNRIAKMRPHYHEAVIVLTTDHLQGPFAILVVGVGASTVSFVGEHAAYWLILPLWQRFFTRSAQSQPKKKRVQVKNQNSRKTRKKPHSRKRWTKTLVNKDNDNSSTRTVKVTVVRPVRFTPLTRRIVH